MNAQVHKTILLVEDELFLRDLYDLQFSQIGMTVVTASGGKEALEKAKEKPYDGILLDIMMPDMTGLEVIKVLKEDEQTKNIPVIFLSNMGQNDVVEKGLQLGAIGFLVKSVYSPEQLIQEVIRLLDKASASPAPAGSSTPEQ